MANTPATSINSATHVVSIFNQKGESLEVTRLNALDLIRGGGYFWNSADIHNPRPEADGPADPSSPVKTVYDADGTKFEMESANARDMVAAGTYFWNPPAPDVATEASALDAVIDAATELLKVTPTLDTASANPVTEADLLSETLTAQALRVVGDDDVAKYLEGFSDANLRDMANQRFGETLHHRASKATMITKIIELEEANTIEEDQADA